MMIFPLETEDPSLFWFFLIGAVYIDCDIKCWVDRLVMVLVINFNGLLASLGKIKYAHFFLFIVYNKIRHAKGYLIREITLTV